MEYCGFSICVKRLRIYDELPIRKIPNDNNAYCTSRHGKDSKEALTSNAILEVLVDGFKVVDLAFVYELRTILEEFFSKRLGEYKPGQQINRVFEPFERDAGCLVIERIDSELVLKLLSASDEDDGGYEHEIAKLNVIKAKTLHGILHKAIQCADFQ